MDLFIILCIARYDHPHILALWQWMDLFMISCTARYDHPLCSWYRVRPGMTTHTSWPYDNEWMCSWYRVWPGMTTRTSWPYGNEWICSWYRVRPGMTTHTLWQWMDLFMISCTARYDHPCSWYRVRPGMTTHVHDIVYGQVWPPMFMISCTARYDHPHIHDIVYGQVWPSPHSWYCVRPGMTTHTSWPAREPWVWRSWSRCRTLTPASFLSAEAGSLLAPLLLLRVWGPMWRYM